MWLEHQFSADWNQEVCRTGHNPRTRLNAILQLSVKPAKIPCIKPRSARSEDAVQWTPRSCRAHQASDGMHGLPLAQPSCSPASAAAQDLSQGQHHLCTSEGTSKTYCMPPAVRLQIKCMSEGTKQILVLMQTESAQGPAGPVCQRRQPGCPSGRGAWRLCSRRACRR